MAAIASARPLVWLHGEIRSPPFTAKGRVEAGELLRRLQQGELLKLPHSRSMPAVGPSCHELRVNDEGGNWRIIYSLQPDAVVVLAAFAKKSRRTPDREIATSRERLRRYLSDVARR